MDTTDGQRELPKSPEEPKKPKRRKHTKKSTWKKRLVLLFKIFCLLLFFVMAAYIAFHRCDMTIPVQKNVPSPLTRAQECMNKCQQVCMSDKPMTTRVLPPPAETNQMLFAQKADEPRLPESQKKLGRQRAPKKPAPCEQRYEEKALATSTPIEDDLGPWATNTLRENLPASRPQSASRDTCFSYFSRELPGVLPLRIEDYCACVAKKSGQSIAKLSTAEEILTAWSAQGQACYGTRFTKVSAAEDMQFFRACEADRGKLFPAYAQTHEFRKSGFCACYGSGLSARGFDPNRMSELSRDVTDRVYQKCFVRYPPEM